MQVKNLHLHKKKLGALPIIDLFLRRLQLGDLLQEKISHVRYCQAIQLLIKNILVERAALYRVPEWALSFDKSTVFNKPFTDDILGRALDKLASIDRASFQTKILVKAIKEFNLETSTIHNDTTSIRFYGAYQTQSVSYVQLKRGHSKDHRPDLKQLVYSLCITADGAVPIHFKSYTGNRTDDSIHKEVWTTLRGFLGVSDFLYVADCKLCVAETMHYIDQNQGRFITVVPKTRSETKDFADKVYGSEVRWEEILRRRSSRDSKRFDVIQHAVGLYQLTEGYVIHWFRSSEKKQKDRESREERILKTIEKLSVLMSRKRRGPKTIKGYENKVNQILTECGSKKWFKVEVKLEKEELFKKATAGRPSKDTYYVKKEKNKIRIIYHRNEEQIARSKAMDGIFPLTTNTKLLPVKILKHYKYQPYVEKRHSLLKSVMAVAPVFLKKNKRIESLMFIYFMAQLLASLIEREIRKEMKNKKIKTLNLLPEGRETKSPTWEQLRQLFKGQAKYYLKNKNELVKIFSDDLDKTQKLVLELFNIHPKIFC